MNRLEKKLGRECTDYDFDVQQELLERARRELKNAHNVLIAVVAAAGGEVRVNEGDLTNPRGLHLIVEDSIVDLMRRFRVREDPARASEDTAKGV